MLASNYLPHGYWFYVCGLIPEHKSPAVIDERILAKYDIRLSRQQRYRRKQQGMANLHYLRFERHFVILATHGRHVFFEAEAGNIRDARKTPIPFGGYNIAVKRGGFIRKTASQISAVQDDRYRVRVKIGRKALCNLSACLLELSTHRTADNLEWAMWNQPYEPYAPVRKQLLNLLRQINAKRSAMGYDKLSPSCIRYRRQIVKPFADSEYHDRS